MCKETPTPMFQVATSSALYAIPRKLIISLSREDLDNLNLALCEDEDFTLGPQGAYTLVFTRRHGYWLDVSLPQQNARAFTCSSCGKPFSSWPYNRTAPPLARQRSPCCAQWSLPNA